MTKRIILHVGAPKTGTTTIQSFLNTYRAEIQSAGARFAKFDAFKFPDHIGRGHTNLALSIALIKGTPAHLAWADKSVARSAVSDEIKQLEEGAFDTLIMSHESLMTARLDTDYLASIAGGKNIKILAYLRRFDEYLHSYYSWSVTSENAIPSSIENAPMIKNMEKWAFLPRLRLFRETLPDAEILVKSFDAEKRNLLIGFLNSCGISDSSIHDLAKTFVSKNVSLNVPDTLFLSSVNQAIGKGLLSTAVTKALRRLSSGSNVHPLKDAQLAIITPEIRKAARAIWNAEQDALVREFGFAGDPLPEVPDSDPAIRYALNSDDMQKMLDYIQPALSKDAWEAVSKGLSSRQGGGRIGYSRPKKIAIPQLRSNPSLLLELIDRPDERANHAPFFVFSLHKCGSTMLTNMIEAALKSAKEPYLNMPETFFNASVPDGLWRRENALLQAIEPGVTYTGFRYLPGFINRPVLRQGKSVLLVRDPRDALVSAYFSFGANGSHRLPGNGTGAAAEALSKEQAKTADMSIDAWVMQRAPVVAKEFMRYAPHVGQPDFRLFRYEDVLFDKARLLADVFAHFGLPLPANAAAIAERHHVLPGKEDPSKHIRKATPGDHRDKLTPETIAELDRILAEPLRFYGYTS